jgi:hypothetical protein
VQGVHFDSTMAGMWIGFGRYPASGPSHSLSHGGLRTHAPRARRGTRSAAADGRKSPSGRVSTCSPVTTSVPFM